MRLLIAPLYMMKRNFFENWNPVIIMLAIVFAFAVVNILLEKVLNEGMNPLVLITYRQLISILFIAPIAYFRERNSRTKLTGRILCDLFFSAIVGDSIYLPSWNTIYLCYFLVRFHQHGSCHHIHNGVTFRVRNFEYKM